MASMSDRGARLKPLPLTCRGMLTPIDFVGVGAQRSDTTRWFDLIVAHPDVTAPHATRNELRPIRPLALQGVHGRRRHLQRVFPAARGPAHRRVEPSYVVSPWGPTRLVAAVPKARLSQPTYGADRRAERVPPERAHSSSTAEPCDVWRSTVVNRQGAASRRRPGVSRPHLWAILRAPRASEAGGVNVRTS